ncbi:hypothetical protein LFL96_01295 [Paraburkholderia sp. D15]|uniref:hypothetical protein n=1 Tax=Paraburkholderia sp. D15 TaxID=2880218 RepID=UPI002479BC4E|nr:hypothetical protein [Paraburkholderia sp. D15]WGS50173.1 hypothetical protein LFL96_01295 [Paraburkholderia sp. D15]
MDDITYTKGIYTATASIKQVQNDAWQGVVTLARDEGDAADQETTAYEVDSTSSTPEEALEEAKALAHRILGDIEL